MSIMHGAEKPFSKHNCNHRGAFDLDFALLSHPTGMAFAGTFRVDDSGLRLSVRSNV